MRGRLPLLATRRLLAPLSDFLKRIQREVKNQRAFAFSQKWFLCQPSITAFILPFSSCSSRLTGSRCWRSLSRICKRKELRSLSTSSPMEARPWKWIWQQGGQSECFSSLNSVPYLAWRNKFKRFSIFASDLVWQTAPWNKWFGRISLRPDSLLPRKKSLAPDWGNRFWLLLAW